MALQVWLPLTKDLGNQGLSDVTVMNNGATFNSAGKLGGCYTSTISGQTISINFSNLSTMLANGKTYSLTCWVKPTGIPSTGWVIKLGDNTCGLWWAKSAARWVWNENDNGKRCANETISSDYTNWHHLAIVVDKTVSGKITTQQYVDGELADGYPGTTWDSSSHLQPTGTTITISPYVALLNDIRLYDHCLSPTEVKKLSKGLVLHYPLNRGGWGQNNLIVTNSMAPTSGTSGWSKAGTDWANSNVVSSGASNGHAIRCTYSGTAQVSGGIHHPTGVDKTTLTNGATYTLSARIRASKACIATFQNELMTTSHTINLTTDWKIYAYSSTIDNTKTYHSNIIYVRAADATQNMWIECDWIKLEEGSNNTPWIPNLADPLYTTMGLNGTTEYDTSGYCNDGTRKGTFTWSSDTPKYDVSTEFDNSRPNYIQVPNSAYALQGAEAITVSVWAYMDDWTSFTERIYSSTESGGYNIESSGSNLQWAVNVYTTADKTSYAYATSSSNIYLYLTVPKSSLTSGWHMFTWVYDVTSTHLYIDGVLKTSKTATSYGIHFSTTAPLIIGGESAGTTASTPYFTGRQSDFRIYATALSADDVKSLYQNCATIDADGTIHGQIRS